MSKLKELFPTHSEADLDHILKCSFNLGSYDDFRELRQAVGRGAPSGQAGPHQLLPYSRQPIPTNPMAPTWSQLTPFCQPSLMKESSAASLAAGYSSFPTVHGFPLPPAPLQQQHGLTLSHHDVLSHLYKCPLHQHFLQFTIPRYQQHPISSKLLTPRHFTIRLHQHKAPWHH